MTQPLIMVLLVVTRAHALRTCAWTVTHGVARVPLADLSLTAAPRCACPALGVQVLSRESRCLTAGGFYSG